MQSSSTRRGFLRDATLAVLTAGFSRDAWSQAALTERLDWASFTQGPDYASFMDAIKTMKANKNAADKRSWKYWANVHLNYCPHGIPYFLAWHRGFIHLFEKQIRAMCGNPAFALPYWNYYDDPTIPIEFTDSGSWNPLFESSRVNSNVAQALTLAPFAGTIKNFQRGLSNAFEPSVESAPHNPVHDLLGGIFDTMSSPIDPIFWLHHANIDRFINAWVAAGGGRAMPISTDPYWDGTFTYSTQLTMPRASTMDSRINLRYYYADETLPGALPAAMATAAATEQSGLAGTQRTAPRALAAPAQQVPPRPPYGSFRSTPMRHTGVNKVSLGGASSVGLGRVSFSVKIALDRNGYQLLASMVDSFRSSPFVTAQGSVRKQPYTSVKLILNDVMLSKTGSAGGYFYNVYLNLPEQPRATDVQESYLCGNVGPFRINVEMHHNGGQNGCKLEYDITDLVLANRLSDLSVHSFSFARISGENAPDGDVITVGECRLELN
jgi:tyrosinase